MPANSIFSGPIKHLVSMLCVLMKVLSHANAKKLKKDLRISNFAHLLVVFKWHHGSDGVNKQKKDLPAGRLPEENARAWRQRRWAQRRKPGQPPAYPCDSRCGTASGRTCLPVTWTALPPPSSLPEEASGTRRLGLRSRTPGSTERKQARDQNARKVNKKKKKKKTV